VVRKAKLIKIDANFEDVAKCMATVKKKRDGKKKIKKPVDKHANT